MFSKTGKYVCPFKSRKAENLGVLLLQFLLPFSGFCLCIFTDRLKVKHKICDIKVIFKK